MSHPHVERLIGAALLLLLALPPARALLETSMAGHMLIQIPLLVVAGAHLGGNLPASWRATLHPWDPHGLTGLLLASFTLTLWMLPRALDAALETPEIAALKFLTLPLLAGAPLRWSWPRLPSVARGALWSKLLSMLGVMGWLYLEAPVRVCNSYLVNDQVMVGRLMLVALAVLAAVLVLRAFWGPRPGYGLHSLQGQGETGR